MQNRYVLYNRISPIGFYGCTRIEIVWEILYMKKHKGMRQKLASIMLTDGFSAPRVCLFTTSLVCNVNKTR